MKLEKLPKGWEIPKPKKYEEIKEKARKELDELFFKEKGGEKDRPSNVIPFEKRRRIDAKGRQYEKRGIRDIEVIEKE